jgi:hypothetical protein
VNSARLPLDAILNLMECNLEFVEFLRIFCSKNRSKLLQAVYQTSSFNGKFEFVLFCVFSAFYFVIYL